RRPHKKEGGRFFDVRLAVAQREVVTVSLFEVRVTRAEEERITVVNNILQLIYRRRVGGSAVVEAQVFAIAEPDGGHHLREDVLEASVYREGAGKFPIALQGRTLNVKTGVHHHLAVVEHIA